MAASKDRNRADLGGEYGVAVLRGGARGAVRGQIDFLLKDASRRPQPARTPFPGQFQPDFLRNDGGGGRSGGPKKVHGRDVYEFGQGVLPVVVWFEKDDAVFTRADLVAAVAAVLDGRAPNAADHPIRAELRKAE